MADEAIKDGAFYAELPIFFGQRPTVSELISRALWVFVAV